MLTHQKFIIGGDGGGGAGVNEIRVTALHDKKKRARDKKKSELDFSYELRFYKRTEKKKTTENWFNAIQMHSQRLLASTCATAAFYKAKRHRRPTERTCFHLFALIFAFI